jgi:acyl-CoA reductase-like NAD-dependent aldehyde dehydrogenase
MTTTIKLSIPPAFEARAETRAVQARWALTPIRERLRVVRELRHLIAENANALAVAAGAVSGRPLAEKLVSEVLPLADACRWLERNAGRVLFPRRCGKRGRPFWLQGVSFEVQRQPLGVVLVIAPGNYPLFLPAVHSLHALIAGNAALLKPAPGTRDVALAFSNLAQGAGLDPALLTILPESVEAARHAIADGVDKVIFTGSSENGREVLSTLVGTNTPAVMELSGQDAVLVLADADLELVVRALRFGTRLNAGETCIAPRRLVVVQSIADDLLARLSAAHVPLPCIGRTPQASRSALPFSPATSRRPAHSPHASRPASS